jgi:phosphoribosylglycinamide formyltransferase-1
MNFAIFASGNGSNAQAIIEYFCWGRQLVPALIVSNTPRAFVLQRASRAGLPAYIHNSNEVALLSCLRAHDIRLIVLAGYLKLIPPLIIQSFPQAILNIHPSLLPKYGGKGMYGIKVHEAVLQAGECQTGFTIHLVNEKYDEGDILMQKTINIPPACKAEELMLKVQELERYYYPRFIENYAAALL